jgi:hypothetical protein
LFVFQANELQHTGDQSLLSGGLTLDIPPLMLQATVIRDVRLALRECDIPRLDVALSSIDGNDLLNDLHNNVQSSTSTWLPSAKAEYIQAMHEFKDSRAREDLIDALGKAAITGK